MISLLRNSLTVQIVGIALLALGAWSANNAWQRSKGAAAVTEKIEKKADDNARAADAIREDVKSGKRGKPDPHVRGVQR